MASLRSFIDCNNVAVKTCEMVGENPNCPDWRDAYHWKVTLRAKIDGRRTQLTCFFSMGYGLDREPTAADILDCLASDSASVENCVGFEDWAGDLGYDPDSRTAEKTFKACRKAAERLEKFLGRDYRDLLYNTERL